ncbi:hypothetical protein D9M71_186080 [compost metagenome]
MRLSRFPQAIAAYQKALQLKPDFPEAKANLALAEALEKDHESQQDAGPPNEKPDKVDFDNQAGKGKLVEQKTAMAASDQLWLKNLNTSPAQFLKRKFLLQQAARKQPAGGTP